MIIFIGDIHGEFNKLSNKLANTNIKNSTFIQVGDFGLGFKRKENEIDQLTVLNKRLKDVNNEMFVIRGNHDDPTYFTSDRSYSNILFLEDYTLLNVEGKNILLVGGAISIDRSWRVLNNSYWLEEVFLYDNLKLENALRNCDRVDVVVTHNAPAEFYPIGIGALVYDFTDKDSKLIEDVKNERKDHSLLMYSLIEKGLKPKHWYYGHFHTSHFETFEDINYRTLNCSEFFEHRQSNEVINVDCK
jgi:predicted phosphodiesterase